jgi:hypothetical protein
VAEFLTKAGEVEGRDVIESLIRHEQPGEEPEPTKVAAPAVEKVNQDVLGDLVAGAQKPEPEKEEEAPLGPATSPSEDHSVIDDLLNANQKENERGGPSV